MDARKKAGRLIYRCTVCGKSDRKGRLVAHLLKTHVSLDQVPFSCSLCNFRCTDRAQLLRHITRYQRHREEVIRLGSVNNKTVLRRSQNPVNIDAYLEAQSEPMDDEDVGDDDVERSLYEDGDDNSLPSWLADLEEPLIAVPIKPQDAWVSSQTWNQQERSTPPAAIGYEMSQKSPLQSIRVAPMPAQVIQPLANTTLAQTQVFGTVSAFHSPVSARPVSRGRKLTSPPATRKPATVTSSANMPNMTIPVVSIPCDAPTPVQDENEDVLAALLGADDLQDDPLFKEEDCREHVQAAAHKESQDKSVEDAIRQSTIEIVNAFNKGVKDLTKALHDQTREVKALHSALQNLAGEVRGTRQGIDALRREQRPRTPLRRSPEKKSHSKENRDSKR